MDPSFIIWNVLLRVILIAAAIGVAFFLIGRLTGAQ